MDVFPEGFPIGRCPGRFLLTGSANLLTLSTVEESLAGRVEIIPLYPLAQSELKRNKLPRFIDKIFKGEISAKAASLTSDELIQLVAAGGYPEALARSTERRRQDWYHAYLASIIERDVPDVAALTKPGQLPALLQLAAQFASRLTNLSEIGRAVALAHKTTDSYLRVLAQVFLRRRIQPWFRNELSRAVKTLKLHFLDSGLLTVMRGYSLARLRADRDTFGAVLVTLVFSELIKLSSWADEHTALYYYRDKDQCEVDFVLENAAGQIVGIEVTAAASITRRDFRGLERLAAVAGSKFILGVILYDGAQTLAFADQLRAAPLSVLWSP